MKRLVILGLAIAFAAAACNRDNGTGSSKSAGDKAGPSVFQKLTYDEALAKARREKTVVMIDFYADWCVPCRDLEESTFRDDKVQAFLQDRTVAIRVNIDKDRSLTSKFGVGSIPCLVFLGSEGQERGRIIGAVPAEEFLQKARPFVD